MLRRIIHTLSPLFPHFVEDVPPHSRRHSVCCPTSSSRLKKQGCFSAHKIISVAHFYVQQITPEKYIFRLTLYQLKISTRLKSQKHATKICQTVKIKALRPCSARRGKTTHRATALRGPGRSAPNGTLSHITRRGKIRFAAV